MPISSAMNAMTSANAPPTPVATNEKLLRQMTGQESQRGTLLVAKQVPHHRDGQSEKPKDNDKAHHARHNIVRHKHPFEDKPNSDPGAEQRDRSSADQQDGQHHLLEREY